MESQSRLVLTFSKIAEISKFEPSAGWGCPVGARRLVRDHQSLVQDRHGAGAGGRRHGARGGPQPRGDEGGGEGGDLVQIAVLCFRISHFGISSETHLANTNIKMSKTGRVRRAINYIVSYQPKSFSLVTQT